MRFGDGGGLYLPVAPGNAKSWLFRFPLHGKVREMGLGPVGDPPGAVPPAEARKLTGGRCQIFQASPITDIDHNLTSGRSLIMPATGRYAVEVGCTMSA